MARNRARDGEWRAFELNEDLAREYQAIIAYVIYSQALKGAEYMTDRRAAAGRAVGRRHDDAAR